MRSHLVSKIVAVILAALLVCPLLPAGLIPAVAEQLGGYTDLTRLVPSGVSVGWGTLRVNEDLNGGPVDMLVDGQVRVFERGIVAHASSFLIYDISELDAGVFTAYIGVDQTSDNNSASVRFRVYTDGVLQYESPQLGYHDDAIRIVVPIPEGTATFKLETDSCGSQTSDHSAWGEPRLYKEAADDWNYDFSAGTAVLNGTYVARGTIVNADRVTVEGEAVLILSEGSSVTLSGGIELSEGNKLTIRGSGYLYAGAAAGNAAIGSFSCGDLVIEGGVITATGGDRGAGIGGSSNSRGVGSVTVTGGSVTATGNGGGAGIGGGSNVNWGGHYGNFGTVSITGGSVNATGSGGGAGIGGGGTARSDTGAGNVGSISITGGSVVANGGENGHGIGPGVSTGNASNSGSVCPVTLGAVSGLRASSYRGTFTIVDGVTLIGGSSRYSGTLTDEQLPALAGVTLHVSSGSGDGGGLVIIVDPQEGFYGSGAEYDPFVIYSQKGFDRVRVMFLHDDGRMNVYFRLDCDVVASEVSGYGYACSPIGSEEHPFTGCFDGNGHTISGVSIDSDGANAGFFGVMAGTVKNLDLAGSVAGTENVGGIAGKTTGVIVNCSFSGTVAGTENVGGIAGKCEGASFTGCSFDGTVTAAGNIGGIAGGGSGTVTECTFDGTVTGSEYRVGGICGSFTGTVSDCVSGGSVKGYEYVGGIAGYVPEGAVRSCANSGEVYGENYVGGIVARIDSGSINDCVCESTGSVRGFEYVGGIVGNPCIAVTNCVNRGTVKGNQLVGGVAGGGKNLSIKGCTNYGDVLGQGMIPVHLDGSLGVVASVSECIGGVVGYIYNGSIEICRNYGGVSGGTSVGGVGGDLRSGVPITNCANFGAVTGSHYQTGGIAGSAAMGNISGCYNAGPVINTFNDAHESILQEEGTVGGIAGGTVSRTVIQDCFNVGEIRGNSRVGGIAGENFGEIHRCYNSGNVRIYDSGAAGYYTGGIAGLNINGSISNCYNTAGVAGKTHVGGIAGRTSKIISYCYSTGKISGSESRGAIIGYQYEQGGAYYCYYLDPDNSGLRGIGNVSSPASTAVMEVNEHQIRNGDQYTFLNWDFTDVWFRLPGVGLYLQKGCSEAVDGVVSIKTAEDFVRFRDNVNYGMSYIGQTVRLENDIDLSSIENPEPIGIRLHNSRVYFCGTFDGNGRKITGLKASGSAEYVGLFGEIYYSTITNLQIECTLSGSSNIGGIAACASNSTISGCLVKGTLSGDSKIGGILGYGYDNTITGCAFEGEITGSYQLGGIVGFLRGSVRECFVKANVAGSAESIGGVARNGIGGVVGDLNGGTVERCAILDGHVTGGFGAGGIVGYANYTTGSPTVRDCYSLVTINTEELTNAASGVGGIVGVVENAIIIQNCFFYGGFVSAFMAAGAIVGSGSGTGSIVENCYYSENAVRAFSYEVVNGEVVFSGSWANIGEGSYYNDTRCTVLSDSAFENASSFSGWDFTNIWKIVKDHPTLRCSLYYDLFVGGEQVSVFNRDDIFGDGKASYDPAAHTLTLDDPKIPSHGGYDGIRSVGIDLTIIGTFRPDHLKSRILIVNGDLTVNGDLEILNYDSYGIRVENGDLTILDGTTVVKARGDALYVSGRLTLGGTMKELDCSSVNGGAALIAAGGLTVNGADRLGLVRPMNGRFDGTTVVCGGSAASRVIYRDLAIGSLDGPAYILLEDQTSWNDEDYVVYDDTAVSRRVEITGTVSLYLLSGKTLTLPKGIHLPAGTTLNIYAEDNTARILVENVDARLAGIGGNDGEGAGTLNVYGGTLHIVAGANAANIGAGAGSASHGTLSFGDVTVDAGGGRVLKGERLTVCRGSSGVTLCLCTEHEFVDYRCKYCDRLIAIEEYCDGSGTENDPYLISSRTEWNALGALVAGGFDTTGVCFLQIADITVYGCVGQGRAFNGVYDGGGHVLRLETSGAGNHAPFVNVGNAELKNLHVTGTIDTNGPNVSGLIVNVLGSVKISNCRSSILVNSVGGSPARHGGFVCKANGTSSDRVRVTITGCVFDGTLTGEPADGCSGFVAEANYATVVLTDCVCNAAEANVTNSANFCGAGSGVSLTMKNCFVADCDEMNGQKSGHRIIIKDGLTAGVDGSAATLYTVSGVKTSPAGVLEYNGLLFAEEHAAVAFNAARQVPGAAIFADYPIIRTGDLVEFTMPGRDVTVGFVDEVAGENVTGYANGYSDFPMNDLVDNDPATDATVGSVNGALVLTVRTAAPVRPEAYRVFTTKWLPDVAGYSPSGWTVEAGTNGEDWTVIGEVSDSGGVLIEDRQRSFVFPTEEAGVFCTWFRYTIKGAADHDYMFLLADIHVLGEICLLGDINVDGAVTISDVTALLDILSGTVLPAGDCHEDLNGDGTLSISDVTVLLDVLSGR